MDDLDLAKLSQAAYAGRPTWTHGDCFAYGTTVNDTTTVVAFRGTDPDAIKDWTHDFDAAPEDDAQLGWCHKGFLDDVRGVAPQIMAALKGKPAIIVTGHSKGGAEALIFGGVLVAAGKPPLQISTFGAPRCAVFSSPTLAGLLARVAGTDYRHRDDPVPLVPIGFDHPRTILQLVPPTFALGVIADHYIANYIAALTPSS